MGLNEIKNSGIELTAGENKIRNILKKLYENIDRSVYLYVQPLVCQKRPDFIIIDETYGIAVIEVKDWSSDYILDLNKQQVNLVDRTDQNPIKQVKGYSDLLCGLISNQPEIADLLTDNCFSHVIFSNLTESDIIKRNFQTTLKHPIVQVHPANTLKKLKPQDLFSEEINLSEFDIACIRTTLFPEITVKKEKDNTGHNIEVVFALDKEQEEWARKIPQGHFIVTGIPGSGKTAVLISRAIHLVRENPEWNVLIVSYNKSLSYKIQSKINEIANEMKDSIFHKDISLENISVLTFHQLVAKFSGRKPEHVTLDKWFTEDSIKIGLEKAYPIYDAILVDEYQDFSDDWIKICVKCCKKNNHFTVGNGEGSGINLLLAGDRIQSIYSRTEVSWKSLGIDMRGRSKLFKTTYRNASNHMVLALNFLKQHPKLEKEVMNFYKEEDEVDIEVNSHKNGTIQFIEGQDTILNEYLKKFILEENYLPNDILILCHSKNNCKELIETLPIELRGFGVFVKDINPSQSHKQLIFTTYHSAKGLESKIVFLMNVDRFKEKGESQADMMQRKLLYVGMTRASEKLIIHENNRNNESYAKELRALNRF